MSLKPGEIQFHQWCEPPLTPGTYALDVTQEVSQLGATFGGSLGFSVAGPRFALNPSDVYSVYPPKGQFGEFANALPHVVFTRRTLPWERSLEPGGEPSPDRPWMALLLLTQQDDGGVPEIEQRTVGHLLKPAEAGVAGPAIPRLDDYESGNDLCRTIDVGLGTFQRLAPEIGDLPYLAHVREVETDHKETLSFLADGWFSVVIGNRFPRAEESGGDGAEAVENTVFLVSLEGMRDYLPGGTSPVTAEKVRLAVLASWSFHCYKQYSFKSSMKKLRTGPLTLPPPRTPPTAEKRAAADYVAGALSRGYVALNHHTRLGENSVSWCRGPLTPVSMVPRADYTFHPVPDGLLRYDFNTGLMDVSYAAASQLGRLLALQDRPFARALCAWRDAVQRKARTSAPRDAIRRALNSEAVVSNVEDALAASITRETERGGSSSPDGQLHDGHLDAIVPLEDRCPPPAVREWLARLILLYRIPFLYLVPHEGLLPPNAMRFFSLDPRWIRCLLEGACSVGRNSIEEQAVDEFLANRFFDFIGDAVSAVRRRPDEGAPAAPAAAGAAATPITWPLEGFLLRSPLVEGWQGLEMRAWSTWDEKALQGAAAHALRIDRLAPDVMLCIFNGPVVRIEVRQPPEGMHFGAAPDGAAYVKGNVRMLTPAARAGDQFVPPREIPIPVRDGLPRVVKVAVLAGAIEKALKRDPAGMMPQAMFTSAEFGLQMTESPGRVVIFRAFAPEPDSTPAEPSA